MIGRLPTVSRREWIDLPDGKRKMIYADFHVETAGWPWRCSGRRCGAMIYWVRTDTGADMPLNADGEPHWATCPDRNELITTFG